MRCGVCGQEQGTKHPERCRGPLSANETLHLAECALPGGHGGDCGPRLRQPVHAAWDWAGLMADQDTYDLRGTGGVDYEADGGIPWERRH